MPKARKTQVSIEATPYYHCISRCLRRAFLCGKDSQSGQDFEHRRQWIEDRLLLLSNIFAIDIAAYAILSNHYLCVELYIDPQKAEAWSTREVCTHWHLIHLVDEVKCSSAYQRQTINALKLYYGSVLSRSLDAFTAASPRGKKQLPVVLSEEEVALLLKQPRNLKHRAMLYCIYSAGLRRDELLSLKPADIDSQRNCIVVRQAKGNKKDRVTLLSHTCLNVLRDYFRQYRPKEYLFEGVDGGRYSSTSLRKVFQRALLASGFRRVQHCTPCGIPSQCIY